VPANARPSMVRRGGDDKELDEDRESFIARRGGGIPSFKGTGAFPDRLHHRPNLMVVHGIPWPVRA